MQTLRRHLILSFLIVGTFSFCLTAPPVQAADWSTTELQLQYGTLDVPFVGGDTDTLTVTLQHASGWKYGDNFFFVDWLMADNDTRDVYGEWY